jgi:hypothetical protein
MRQQLKVKIRPGGILIFPDTCVKCSSLAKERMMIRKRIGRSTRTIDVPLCVECNRELQRESAEEERMRSFGRLGSIVGGLLVLIFLFIILPKGLTIPWRVLFATVSSLAFGAVIYFYFESKRSQGARPKKKAILSSATMSNFSWRAATFEFSNESFARHFEELNRPNLMKT